MNTFFKQRLITPFVLCLSILATVALVSGAFLLKKQPPEPKSTSELWEEALVDARTAEADEIMPLVCLTHDDPLTGWNESGDKVLLVSWHSDPERFVQGQTAHLNASEIWAFTEGEIKQWINNHENELDPLELRLEQLIGLGENTGYTHFSAFWISPDEVIRPAYVYDPTEPVMSTDFRDEPKEQYKQWFDMNILWSYYDYAFPWTRLGYTYDWAEDATEYGLSEFLIPNEEEVLVEYTKTTDEFVEYIKSL